MEKVSSTYEHVTIANISALGRSRGLWMLLGVMSLWSIQNPGKPRALSVLGLDSLEYSNVFVCLLYTYGTRHLIRL